MFEAEKQQLKKYSQGLVSFWDWWTDELGQVVRTFSERDKDKNKTELRVIVIGDELEFLHKTDDATVSLGVISIAAETYPDDLLHHLKDQNAQIVIEVPQKYCLRRDMALPKAARADIQNILYNQIDRLTPYGADQVYFDYVTGKADQKDQIKLDLIVLPKAKMAPVLMSLQKLALFPDQICIQGDGASGDVNFLSQGHHGISEKNAASQGASKRWRYAVATVLIIIFLPLIINEVRIMSYQNDIDDLKATAQEAGKVRQIFETRKKDMAFLLNKKQERPLAIKVVDEVSRSLGDGTWLDQMIVRNGTIQLYGYSKSASSIIENLEKSDLFENTRFMSAITKQKKVDADRFHVATDVIDGVPDKLAQTKKSLKRRGS